MWHAPIPFQVVAVAAGLATGKKQPDEPVGRVVLELRNLRTDTVYDSWFELRRASVIDDGGKFGALRIRYSVSWKSERRKLLAYVSPPPAFVLPVPFERKVDAQTCLSHLPTYQ